MFLLLKSRAMWFAAIVEQASRRPVGVRVRITLRQHVPLAVQESKRLVSRLMIKNDKFAEVRAVRQIDHGLPAALHLLSRKRAKEARAALLNDDGPQHAPGILIPGPMAVERAPAFLHIFGV